MSVGSGDESAPASPSSSKQGGNAETGGDAVDVEVNLTGCEDGSAAVSIRAAVR